MADLGKFLVGRGIVGPEQLAEAAGHRQEQWRQGPRDPRQAGLRHERAGHAGDGRHARLRVLRPARRADSAVGRGTGARVGRPRKRGHSAGRRGRCAEGARERSVRLRNVREAAVHSQPQGEHRAGHAREHSGGHQPQLRPDGRRIGRLDAAGIHRYGHRLHRDGRRRRRRTATTSTKPAPRSCGWCS